MNEHNKRYTLLSLGNPYEILYLNNVKSALAVYGKQEPNTAAAIQVMLGHKNAVGVLPVKSEQ